ncbi:MAG: TonB-dependent receptor [Novosphingobium sp.]|nr:TonB-dependent receptor [Novosphingobium sp.]
MLSACLRVAATVFLVVSITGPLLAQDGEPGSDGIAQKPTIIVTGTRILEPEVLGLEPLVSLTNDFLDETGITNVADALNQSPGYRGSVTPAGAQGDFGQGVNFLNAFGIGSNRTLTLVNGHRIVSSNVPTVFTSATPGTQVDLNAVPSILVDRVERISVGGAPVYGSDAIAATVNIILKTRMNGLETRGTSGITSRGDRFRWNLASAGGFNFADGRANLTAAVSYDATSALSATDRSIYRAGLGNAPNPCSRPGTGTCTPFNVVALLGPAGRTPANDGRVNPGIGFNDSTDDGFPGSVLIRDFALPAISTNGVLSNGSGAYRLGFASGGNLVPYDTGIAFGAPASGPFAPASIASGGDGLRLFDYFAIASQVRRLNAALLFTYDLSDSLQFSAEGLFYDGKADEPVQLPAFNATLFRGVSGALTFRTDNPFLSAQARQQLAALGYGQTFQMSRAHVDLADLTGSSHSRLYQLRAGVDGEFRLAGRGYDFSISANYGRSDFTDIGETIDQQRFVNAVNVAMVDGRIACTTTPTVTGFPAGTTPVADPACAPLDLFGSGAPSHEALDYILQRTVAKSRLEQLVFNANVGGSPFALFGNPVHFNLGFEHHSEKAQFQPDAFLEGGLGRSVGIEPVSGSYNLDEAFGEVLLPLITPDNDTILSHLTVFARARHVANSANGNFTAWTLGGSVAPVPDVAFRGNFTRSFRAPAIVELYSPRTNIATGVPDLCSPASIDSGPVPEVRHANCAAFLTTYPNATPLIAATGTVPGLSGGNPGLRNEKADGYTFGLTLAPRVLPGLTFSADYIDIRITDPITQLSVQDIAQGCFDNPQFDASDPANGNPFCSLIRRDVDGQVIADPMDPAVVTGFVNGKRIRMSGVQAQLAYRTGLRGIGLPGSLSVEGDLFHLRRRLIDVTGVAPERSDGIVGDPRWQGQFRLRYSARDWGFRAHLNYIGKQAVARDNRGASPNDTREIDRFRAFETVDSAIWFDVGQDFRLTFGITNLLDRRGERYHGFIIPLSANDAIGRRFSLSFSKSI